MKRILSTTAFLVVIVAIAAVAVYALNGASVAETAAASAIVPGSASVQSDALAPTAAENYNFIALPLDSSDSFAYTASGLAGYVPGSKKVLKWNAVEQQYEAYTVGAPGTPFDLSIGGAYFVLLDSSADNVVSFVGDVPAQGSVSFSLVKDTGSGCKYNAISVPLDQQGINDAADLANAITGIDKVLNWDATNQQYVAYTVGAPGTPFDVSIGYPYFVCANSSAPANWPE